MANTYTLIQSITVGAGGQTSVIFSSIPQTYTDLKLVFSSRVSNASTLGYNTFRFNGDTTNTGYSYRFLDANLGGVGLYSSSSTTNPWFVNAPGASSTASIFSNAEIYIPNYTTTGNKAGSIDSSGENNASTSGAWLDFFATSYATSSPITSITINDLFNGATIVQYSTFYLYGIKNS